jgi:hypothetical protein
MSPPGWAVVALLRLFADDPAVLAGPPYAVICTDVFAWATSDAEPVTLPDDLASLRQARQELPGGDWALLWVCRRRRCRPMPSYRLTPAERALIEAAGPPRDSVIGAP